MKSLTIKGIALFMLLLIASLLSPTDMSASPKITDSTDFYILYSDNLNDGSGADLFITSLNNTYGTVSIPGIGFSQGFSVLANTITTVDIPLAAEVQGSNVIANLGIRITANDDITVYFLNPGEAVYSNDAYVALPVQALGTEYIVMAWPDTIPARGYSVADGPSELAIVSPFDGTSVTIIPSITTGIRSAGVPYNITLNQFETYTLQNDDAYEDLTGTIIQSTAPVAVFSGNRCADIPAGYGWCDHLVEQMVPTSNWGKSFVTIPMVGRSGGDYLRILASVDGTTVNINGPTVASLDQLKPSGDLNELHNNDDPSRGAKGKSNTKPAIKFPDDQIKTTVSQNLARGEFYELLITGPVEITADKPILAAQFGTGQDFGGLGDPLMMLLSPSEQFLPKYTFLTPTTYAANYVSIIAPSAASSSFVLDGTALDSSIFSPINTTTFSGAAIPLSEGSHTISGSQPFAIYVYGFGDYVSYGYPGGIGTNIINPPPPPSHLPIIIVPGLAGTRLVNDEGELWLNVEKMCQDSRDNSWRPKNDYLDVLQLDASGTKPLDPANSHYASVQSSTVIMRASGTCDLGIIGKYPFEFDVYQSIVDYFKGQGYTLGQDLFLFGYDWRRDIGETASQLDALVESARKGGKVNLVAHSMGGLVSRNYILDSTRANKVEKLVILGTPFLGAPYDFKGLYLGDDFGINKRVHDMGLPGFMWLVNEDKVKQIARNFPGLYEILPSQRFFEVYDGDDEKGYLREDRDINGDGQASGDQDYSNTKKILSSVLNSQLVNKAEQLHSQAFDGFDGGANGVKVYLVVGLGFPTKQKVWFWEKPTWLDLGTEQHTSWRYDNGDGTVLQRSADLHDDNTDFRGDAKVYYIQAEHGVLPQNSHVQQQITSLFAGNPSPVNENIKTSPDAFALDGYWQEVNSPVELHIYDELGNHLGPTPEGTIEYGIKGAQYDVVGHDKSAFIPKGIRYTVVLTGTEQGKFDLRLKDVQGGSIATTALFKDIPVNADNTAKVSLDPADNYVMSLDRTNDGVPDENIPPNAILDPIQSQDTVPPTTTISVTPSGNDFLIELIAADNPGGSGIERIEYTIDGGATVHMYSGPFTVNPTEVSVIYAKAIDRAGNEEYPLASATVVSRTNDDFDFATTISGTPYSTTQDTTTATRTATDPNLCRGGSEGPGSASVWYKFVAPQNGTLSVGTVNSSYDTVSAIFTGTRDNLTRVACQDDVNGVRQASVSANVSAGTTYYIEIADRTLSTSQKNKEGKKAPEIGGSLQLNVDYAPVTTIVSVARAFTTDSNNVIKSQFHRRERIRYFGQLTNSGSIPVTTKVMWEIKGPAPLAYWTGSIAIAPGTSYWYLTAKIRKNAPLGKYKLKVTTDFNGQITTKKKVFYVIGGTAVDVADSAGAQSPILFERK